MGRRKMAYAKTVLNRRNYRPKRVVRAKKNLKQLVVLALHAASSSALSFNQIQAVLKRSLKLHVSNFVLKRTLHQLRESGHVARSNGQYVSTGKRLKNNRNTKKLLSRKARKRVMKLAFRARKDVKKQVSGVLRARNAVLEKLILKSIRALKRQHKSEGRGRRGFYFQSIKAMVKQLAKHKGKKLRNIVIVKALESLRASGKVVLKRGKNYLTKSGNSKNVAKPKQTRKRNKSSKKLRKPKKMAKRKKKSRTTKR